MPKGNRKSRGWEAKIKRLSDRGMIIVYNDVEYLSSEGFLYLVTQDESLFHLLPYAVCIYTQEGNCKKCHMTPLCYMQTNQDPYITRSKDPIRNVKMRSERSEKHNPRAVSLTTQKTTKAKMSAEEPVSSVHSGHTRTIHKRPFESSGSTSANLSFLNRKVLQAMSTFLKARFIGFSLGEKKVDINMKDVTKDVMEHKDLNVGIVKDGNIKLAQSLERLLTKNSEFAAELFLLSDMSVEKWRLLRSFLVHKYSPFSKCPLPKTVEDTPLPSLWPSYNRVLDGLKSIDLQLPQYDVIKDLPNPGQIGYRFRRKDFCIALSRLLHSNQKLYFEKKDLTMSLQDYQKHLQETKEPLAPVPIINGDLVIC